VFVTSRLDYCNAILPGLPKSTIAPLQCVQNATARLSLNLRHHEHITLALQRLGWLPVQWRIEYKLAVMMHSVHNGQCPSSLPAGHCTHSCQ